MPNNRTVALIALSLVQLIYGFNFTFVNDVIDGSYVKPYGFILLRVAGAAVLFWIFSLFYKQEKIALKDFFTLFIAAFFGLTLNMLTFFKGFEYTTPIHASVIMIVVPIIVLVLSAIFLKERITRTKIIGVIIGFSGAIILSVYGRSAVSGDNVLLGNFLVFINAVSYSIYLIIIKKLTYKYHPFTFIKWLFLFGTLLVLPFGYSELQAVEWQNFNGYIYFSIVFVTVAGTFFTYLLNPLALATLKASTVSSFIYLQPIVAVLFALAMGSDTFDTVKGIAMVLIFGGVYLASMRPKS
ncbi:MAG TPA: DMT family transporter [Flavobacteriaceae bacterium]|nr:DMT family transporter [Flavobacteriaceae bacterium]